MPITSEEKKENERIRSRQYRKKNLEKRKTAERAYYLKNSEKLKADSRVRYLKNKEKIAETFHKWRAENPIEHRANLRKHRLKKQYSLTIEAYDRMYREQQGTCSVCGDIKKHPATAGAKRNEVLHIDHCHKSGKVRALICAHCNKALGLFKENVKSLQNAIDYIEYFANLQLL